MWTQASTEGGMTIWTDGRGSSLSLPVGQRPAEQGPAIPLAHPPEPVLRQMLPPSELHELRTIVYIIDDTIRRCLREASAHGAETFHLRLLRNALNDQFREGLAAEAWRAPAGTLPDFTALGAPERRQVEMLRSMGTRLLALIEHYRRDPQVAPELFKPFLDIRDRLNAAFPPTAAEGSTSPTLAHGTAVETPPASGQTEQAAATSETESGPDPEHARCTVCALPEETRSSIREKLCTGEPLRSVATQFNVSLSALFRHKQHTPAEG